VDGGFLLSDYDVNAAKKISISGNNFEALIMAVKYEGGSHGVLPKSATRWSNAAEGMLLDSSIA